MTTNRCSLKTEENLNSAMPMRSVQILRQGRPGCGTWTALLLEAAPAKGFQDRAGGRCSVAVWKSTNTQLATVPTQSSHCGCTQLCARLRGPWPLLVSHPPARAQPAQWGVNRPQPSQGLHQHGQGCRAQLNKLLLQMRPIREQGFPNAG